MIDFLTKELFEVELYRAILWLLCGLMSAVLYRNIHKGNIERHYVLSIVFGPFALLVNSGALYSIASRNP